MQEADTTFFVNFISFDKEKSTRLPGILSKLAQQLTQYIDIQQPVILEDINKNISEALFLSTENYNMWKFGWTPKNVKLSEFIEKHAYIGTKVLRLFFTQNDYTQDDLSYENLQKLQIYNVQRLNTIAGQNPKESNSQFWNKGAKGEGPKQFTRNPAQQTSTQSSQPKEKEPETYDEYALKIVQLQEKLKEAKVLNKELKDTNYILDDALENQQSIINTQQKTLDTIENMVQEPLDLLFPNKGQQEQEQQEEDNQQQEEAKETDKQNNQELQQEEEQ